MKELSMVATLIGETGANVQSRVVEDYVQEADHAITLLHSTVGQTARRLDQVRKLGTAVKVHVQVNVYLLKL